MEVCFSSSSPNNGFSLLEHAHHSMQTPGERKSHCRGHFAGSLQPFSWWERLWRPIKESPHCSCPSYPASHSSQAPRHRRDGRGHFDSSLLPFPGRKGYGDLSNYSPPPSRWAHGVKIHCEALNDRSLWPSPTRRRQWKPVSPSCERGHGGHPGHNTPKVPGRLAPGLSASGFHIILLTSYSADPSPAWFSQTLLFPNPILAPESLPS